MLTWLNGAFGSGKTTSATSMVGQDNSWRLFDPEYVGYMLASNLRGVAFDDFQDLPAWRRLVPQVAKEVAMQTGSNLVAVQTVLNEAYWNELAKGLSELQLSVFHVVLDCDEDVLRQRISTDEVEPGPRQWRLDHLVAYQLAKNWMTSAADLVIDTSAMSPADVAAEVLASTPIPSI